MYGGRKSSNLQLNDLRYLCFKSSSTKKAFNLAMLPPTELAAKQHTFRAYYQVQQWLGKSLDPTQWGWSVRDNKLQPTLVEICLSKLGVVASNLIVKVGSLLPTCNVFSPTLLLFRRMSVTSK